MPDPRIITEARMTVDDTPASAAARAVAYTINSSSTKLSRAAQDTLSGIAHRVGRLLATTTSDSHGNPEHWRVIAAVALQMEAKALGLSYSFAVELGQQSIDARLTNDQ